MKNSAAAGKISIWIPTIFCTFISVLKMFAPNGAGDSAFYSFLPLCFLLVAFVHLSLWKRIETLEAARNDH